MNVVVPIGSRLDIIKRRIKNGHERATKGGAEWIEGTLEVAAALFEGRDQELGHISFSAWLKENGLDFYSKDDRMALIGFAGDLALARAVLTESKSRSYVVIWRENKSRFRKSSTTDRPTGKRYSKPRVRNKDRAMNHRRMKLGDEIVDTLKGTSLDSAAELDALVLLNRGAPEGELNEIVQHLVAEACAGKDVSAIAETVKLAPTRTRKRPTLVEAWRKRMVFAWEQADHNEQVKFVEYLMEHIKDEGTHHDQ
jgi:hypothetical protein